MDIIILPFFALLFIKIFVGIRTKINLVNADFTETRFFEDLPADIEFLPPRLTYIIDTIIQRINSTETSNSFAIAIKGEWGIGKTTFLKAVASKINEEEKIIHFEFNPWVYDDNLSITSNFLTKLSNELSNYHSGAKKSLKNYINSLSANIEHPVTHLIQSATLDTNANLPLNIEVNRINEVIRQIGKKIVVYIDDMDRLDSDEILEILKLIRNSANFKNTFFLVSMDSEYVTKAINTRNSHQSKSYTEKIFQLEINLRRNNSDDIGKDLLCEIKKSLPEYTNSNILTILKYASEYLEIDCAIFNFRDVQRFLNTFFLNINEEICAETYFPDFFNLQLLLFKYPRIYNLIHRERELYLGRPNYTLSGTSTVNHPSDIFKLVYDEDTQNKSFDMYSNERSLLEKYIENNHEKLSLNSEHVKPCIKLIKSLFEHRYLPISTSDNDNKNFKIPNESLRLRNKVSFERYFEHSSQGFLSQIDFDNNRKESWSKFSKQIIEWATHEKLGNELYFKLDNFNINDFESGDDYKKHIRILAKLTTLDDLISYKPIFKKLLFASEHRMSFSPYVTEKYFDNNETQRAKFVIDLCDEYESLNNKVLLAIVNEIKKPEQSDYDNNLLVNIRELLKEFTQQRFHNILRSATEFDWDLHRNYQLALRSEIDFQILGENYDSISPSSHFKKDMIKFIKSNIEPFIYMPETKKSYAIKYCPNHDGNLMFAKVVKEFFGTNEKFNIYVQKTKSNYKKDIEVLLKASESSATKCTEITLPKIEIEQDYIF